MAKKAGKKRVRRNVARGIAHIKATFNNTLITITDANDETLCWASSGTMGFKGTRKSTPFAAQRAAKDDDFWTVATRDGRWAAHFEQTIAVTDNGSDVLTDGR